MSERRLIALAEVKAEPQNWLWRDRIPIRTVTSLEGDPGDGKSTLMYDIAARLTTGRPMPFSEEASDPAGVVILQAEDSLTETVRPALDAAGADVDRICVYDRTKFLDQPLILSEDLELIRGAVKLLGAKLVVVDPFTAFSGHSLNAEIAVRRTLSKLALLAEEHDLAVVVVRHMPKHRSSNPKNNGLGSIEFVATVRSALTVLPDPTNTSPHQHILATSMCNLSDAVPLIYRTVKKDGVICVEWLGEREQSIHELMAGSADRYERSQLEEACFVLYSILAENGEPMPAKDVKRKAGDALVSERTLKRAKSRLRITSRRRQVWDQEQKVDVVKWVWSLPKDEEVLRPYKEQATKEHVDDLLDSIETDEVPATSEAEPEIAPATAGVVQPCDSLISEDATADEVCDWTPSDRPWDDL